MSAEEINFEEIVAGVRQASEANQDQAKRNQDAQRDTEQKRTAANSAKKAEIIKLAASVALAVKNLPNPPKPNIVIGEPIKLKPPTFFRRGDNFRPLYTGWVLTNYTVIGQGDNSWMQRPAPDHPSADQSSLLTDGRIANYRATFIDRVYGESLKIVPTGRAMVTNNALGFFDNYSPPTDPGIDWSSLLLKGLAEFVIEHDIKI